MAKIHRAGSLEGLVPDGTLREILFDTMRNHLTATALVNASRGTSYTYGALLMASQRLAEVLTCQGLKAGDIVTLQGSNSEEYVLVLLAAIHLGLIVNTLNPAATPYEMKHYLKQTQPRLIYTETELLENVQEAIGTLDYKPDLLMRASCEEYLTMSDSGSQTDTDQYSSVNNDHGSSADTGVSSGIRSDGQGSRSAPEDTAFILFSSGTTGLPKGVMLTHRNIATRLYLGAHHRKTRGTAQLWVFPMYHAAGLLGLMGSLYIGGQFVFLEKYNFRVFLEAIDKHKPGSISVPPTVVIMLAKSHLTDQFDLSSITECFSGAAPLKRETEQEFLKKFNISVVTQGYGMTETTSGFMWNKESSAPGSSGRVLPGVEIKVVEPSSGRLLGPYERGELLVRGDMVMKGYLNNPEATQNTIDPDGWLHTGDLVYYNESGDFFIVDRLKELIKYKGNQVAPAELEALLLQHPAVEEAGVVGIPDPDAGEVPRAFVVRKPRTEVSGTELQQFVADHVAPYKRLRGGVMFVKEIPKVGSGKILRSKLRQLGTSGSSKL